MHNQKLCIAQSKSRDLSNYSIKYIDITRYNINVNEIEYIIN